MAHIQAKQQGTPPSHLTSRLAPVDPLPHNPFITAYGVDTIAPESSTPKQTQRTDRWYIIAEGMVEVVEAGQSYKAGPGDMVFIPMLQEHRITGITLAKIVWMEGPPIGAEE